MKHTPEKQPCKFCGETDCQNEMCNETHPMHWENENAMLGDTSIPQLGSEECRFDWTEGTY